MKLDAWMFSAKQAWQRPLPRYVALAIGLLSLVGVSVFFWKTIPAARQSGQMVLHYTVYLGIDDVRAWPWMFLLPGIGIMVVLVDLLLAFGLYRSDPQAAQGILYLAFGWTVLWMTTLYYLSLVNAV